MDHIPDTVADVADSMRPIAVAVSIVVPGPTAADLQPALPELPEGLRHPAALGAVAGEDPPEAEGGEEDPRYQPWWVN